MKRIFIFICLIIRALSSFSQQAVVMDPRSITVPRYADLTTIQSAILNPQVGMLVYNTATLSYWFYNGTIWQSIPTSSSSSPWLSSGNNIYNNNIGNIGIGTSSPFSKLDILHGGGIGINVKSSSSVSIIDIDGASGGAELRLINSGNLKWKLDNIPTSNNFEIFEFGASNLQRLLLQSGTGNLGVGQSNPTSKVDILHNVDSGLRIKSLSSYSTVDIDAANGDASVRLLSNGVKMWNLRNNPSNNNFEIFEINKGSRLIVEDETGNVGINQPTPLATLHVKSNLANQSTAIIQGTNLSSSFNRGLTEGTYINGGLSNSETHINFDATGNVSIANGGGKVGIGINSIAANERMEVNGRLRLRKDNFTSGLWLNNAVNGTALTDGAFMGLSNDVAGSEKVGFWLNGNYRWEVDRAGNTSQNSVSASNLAGSGSRNVIADANGKLTLGPNEIYTLGSVDFSPGNDNQTYTKDFHLLTPDGGSDSFYAPVHLPNGATILSVIFYFIDGSTNYNIKFGFYGYALDAGSTNAVVATSITSGNSPGIIQNSGAITPISSSVNNLNSYYYISAAPVNNSNIATNWPVSLAGQGSLSIKGVKITYSY